MSMVDAHTGRMLRRVACVLWVFPLLAGCGSGGGASSSPSASSARLTNESQTIVLQQSDLGAGYTVVPAATQPVTRTAELSNESPKARAADRRSWLGGYDATFSGHNSLVVSLGANYTSAGDAAISFADPVGRAAFDRSFHAHAVKTPAGAPGENGSMRVGSTILRGKTVPVRAYLWQHGRALGGIVILGATASSENVLGLARKEDARMANLTAAGIL